MQQQRSQVTPQYFATSQDIDAHKPAARARECVRALTPSVFARQISKSYNMYLDMNSAFVSLQAFRFPAFGMHIGYESKNEIFGPHRPRRIFHQS